ncbi:amidohydrolase family protein [Rhizobium paknamense]|uniref:TIM-barrel fold metal-dependent hydrolase n=1 Tax=Rhizobium paknamense TaxID=1206817 RepID=A0ABU0IJ87_9HYPH|nr:amidohydrolase family protein [Rhizobium paknamense]MDQ0458311.1 putative TIM-barrel fold metal-dependent hydrolase [Rhizobium paknamense]
MTTNNKIDVHHHLIPPAFTAALQKRNIREIAGGPIPQWAPDRSLQVMEDNGIGAAVLSLSAPGVYFGDVQEACDLARACNEYAAEVRDRQPDRFGYFAVLPMPFTEESCKEAIYALDTLKADGIVLLASSEGVFLGDPKLDELMHELDRRKAIVFVHPNLHQTSETLSLQSPGFLLEFLCDTTRAATNLIMTGTMEKYPGITWILAHAGGFLPYVAWRLSLANLMADISANVPQGVLTYIRRFYFDTALSPSPYAMAALQQLVEPSHILFGSDFPFAPPPLTASQVSNLENLAIWPKQQTTAVYRNNALSLFPRFAESNESYEKRPVAAQASFRNKVRQCLQKPILAYGERMRQR